MAWCLWWRISAAGLRLHAVMREKWRAAVGPAARVGGGGGYAPALPYIGGWVASLSPPPSPRPAAKGGRSGGQVFPLLLEGLP
jgi:hypothetical protein